MTAASLLTRLSSTAPPPQLPDGSEIPLPPILLGKLGSDPQKKTVCIYGHLDVQPAALEDGWDSEPFTLVEREGKGTQCLPPKCSALETVLEMLHLGNR